MFKIRQPQLDDFSKLEPLFKDHPMFIYLNNNKLICCIQNFIPPNFRILPSIHLALENNSIVGFIILSSVSKANNSWQIDEVFVLDDIRKQGIGEEIVRYALSVYGGSGVEHFLAEVDSQNFPALSLFHQCGFRRYAKVYFYEKKDMCVNPKAVTLNKDFIIRPKLNTDLMELEKLELSIIPPDLRPALGRSKRFFKEKKDSLILIDKSRNLIIGWAEVKLLEGNNYFIEMLVSPGWTYLYESFLNTLIEGRIPSKNNFNLTVKAVDYNTELAEILTKSGFLPKEVKELLVRTIWQKVKEKQKISGTVGAPSIAPT